jgi:hypothetical protein
LALLKKSILIALSGISLLAAGGYVMAKLAQPSIEQETRSFVLSQRIVGLDMSGREIPSTQIHVSSWVKWPFVVVGSYAVPEGLHSSFYNTTYLVMPWRKYVLSAPSGDQPV